MIKCIENLESIILALSKQPNSTDLFLITFFGGNRLKIHSKYFVTTVNVKVGVVNVDIEF